MKPRNSSEKKQGFTLIELLVIVAILAILAAILFPVLSSARDHALAAKCVLNIRSYGNALLTMAADRGRLPYWDGQSSSQSETGSPQFYKWLSEGNYLPKAPNTLRCPLADGAKFEGVNSRYRFPYAPNIWLCNAFPNIFGGIPAPANRVALVAETNDQDGYESVTSLNKAMWLNGEPGRDGQQENPLGMTIPRYHGSKDKRGLHFFFLDGSVQLLVPPNGDWREPPVFAPISGNAETGYFYHSTHYKNLKSGALYVK